MHLEFVTAGFYGGETCAAWMLDEPQDVTNPSLPQFVRETADLEANSCNTWDDLESCYLVLVPGKN